MPEYWEYIKIYGLDGGMSECFQGLGASAMYGEGESGSGGDGGSGGGDEPDIDRMPEPVWAAQSAVLQQQSNYLDELGTLYAAKKADLPKTESLWDWFVQESVEFFAGLLGGWIAVKLSGGTSLLAKGVGEELGSWIASFLIYVYDELNIRYNAGTVLCEQVAQENRALLALENCRDNYLLRSQISVQHEHTISNVTAWIQAAEQAAKQATSGDLTGLEQAVKDLQYNGERIQQPDGSTMTLVGKTLILEHIPE